MKRIAINGTSGFLGRQLCASLGKKYEIIKINRLDYLIDKHILANKLESADIVVNIAGTSIAKRWTKRYKEHILSSRVDTTKNLVHAMLLLKRKPELFVSFSAIGIYDEIGFHDESSQLYGNNFLSMVCEQWENEALRAQNNNIDTLICRLGIVLSDKGGLLKKMLFPFKIGLGAILGKGDQSFSFISIYDFLKGIDFVIGQHLTGIVNFVAPEFSSNYEFTHELSGILKRPIFIRIPAFFIYLWFGERSLLFLKGQKVYPKVLIDNGFQFEDKNLEFVLYHLIKGRNFGSH